jgi:rare lipoprotein A
MRRFVIYFMLGGMILAMSGCTAQAKAPLRSKSAISSHAKNTHTMVGLASFYGHEWQGRRTANGERLNIHAMTAAHKSLPFGTRVRVTLLSSGKSVIVRINDRGPYVRGRIIDLTDDAASKIGLTVQGVGRVRLELLR